MPTSFEDGDGAEISMFTVYGMYPFSKSETVTFFGKLGYSNPKLDYDDDYYGEVSIDGGIMYGFQANFENIQVSYTIHQGEISDWYDSIDVDFNRFVLYYAF